jgi:hypothetical protein
MGLNPGHLPELPWIRMYGVGVPEEGGSQAYLGMEILAERNCCPDNTTQIENGPESADVFTLLTFSWVS